MERRFLLMIGALLGVALILATATVYTQQVFAHGSSGSGFGNGRGGPCSEGNAGEHNPNCSSGPTGAAFNNLKNHPPM